MRALRRNRRARKEPDEGGDIVLRAWSLPALLRTSWRSLDVKGDGYTLPADAPDLGGDVRGGATRSSGQRGFAFAGRRAAALQPEICGNYNYYFDLYRLVRAGASTAHRVRAASASPAPLETGASRRSGGERQAESSC